MNTATSTIAPGSARAWLLASRPATLLVGLVPVLVGASVALARGPVRLGAVLAALAGALLIQIGTNFANDVFDYEKGADDARRLGPTRAVQAGLLSPRQMRRGMLVAFALAMLAGVYLTWVAGPVIVAIGLVSIAAGVAYTGGPYPLGYNGLGDLFVFVFFGFVAVCGTSFVAAGLVPGQAVLASVPVGALSTAVLVVNNVRDHVTDVDAGKRTLVVRFGRGFGVAEYTALMLAAFATPFVIWRLGNSAAVLLPCATAPLAWRLTHVVAREHGGAALNAALAGTARLMLLFGVLFALGLARG